MIKMMLNTETIKPNEYINTHIIRHINNNDTRLSG